MHGLALIALFARALKATPGPPLPLTITHTNNWSNALAKVTVIANQVNASASMVSGEKDVVVVPAPMNAVDTVSAKVLKSLPVITNHMIPPKTLLLSTTPRGMPNTSMVANVMMVSVVQTAVKLNAHQRKTRWVDKVMRWAEIAPVVEPATTALVFANATLDTTVLCAKRKLSLANF